MTFESVTIVQLDQIFPFEASLRLLISGNPLTRHPCFVSVIMIGFRSADWIFRQSLNVQKSIVILDISAFSLDFLGSV